VQWIGAALVERDGWIEYYQNLELSLNGRIEALEAEIRSRPAPKLPLAAGIRVDGPVEGYWEDGWIGNSFRANLRAEHAISGVEIEGYLPEGSGSGRELEVSLNGNRSLHSIGTGPFRIRMGNVLERGEVLSIRIASDTSHCPARAGTGPDLRELVALLTGIRLIPSAPR
jgi:hypothetical protein